MNQELKHKVNNFFGLFFFYSNFSFGRDAKWPENYPLERIYMPKLTATVVEEVLSNEAYRRRLLRAENRTYAKRAVRKGADETVAETDDDVSDDNGQAVVPPEPATSAARATRATRARTNLVDGEDVYGEAADSPVVRTTKPRGAKRRLSSTSGSSSPSSQLELPPGTQPVVIEDRSLVVKIRRIAPDVLGKIVGEGWDSKGGCQNFGAQNFGSLLSNTGNFLTLVCHTLQTL